MFTRKTILMSDNNCEVLVPITYGSRTRKKGDYLGISRAWIAPDGSCRSLAEITRGDELTQKESILANLYGLLQFAGEEVVENNRFNDFLRTAFKAAYPELPNGDVGVVNFHGLSARVSELWELGVIVVYEQRRFSQPLFDEVA